MQLQNMFRSNDMRCLVQLSSLHTQPRQDPKNSWPDWSSTRLPQLALETWSPKIREYNPVPDLSVCDSCRLIQRLCLAQKLTWRIFPSRLRSESQQARCGSWPLSSIAWKCCSLLSCPLNICFCDWLGVGLFQPPYDFARTTAPFTFVVPHLMTMCFLELRGSMWKHTLSEILVGGKARITRKRPDKVTWPPQPTAQDRGGFCPSVVWLAMGDHSKRRKKVHENAGEQRWPEQFFQEKVRGCVSNFKALCGPCSGQIGGCSALGVAVFPPFAGQKIPDETRISDLEAYWIYLILWQIYVKKWANFTKWPAFWGREWPC